MGCSTSAKTSICRDVWRKTTAGQGCKMRENEAGQPRMHQKKPLEWVFALELGLGSYPGLFVPRDKCLPPHKPSTRSVLNSLIHPDPIADHSLSIDFVFCVHSRHAAPCKNAAGENAGFSCTLQFSPRLTHVQPAEINAATREPQHGTMLLIWGSLFFWLETPVQQTFYSKSNRGKSPRRVSVKMPAPASLWAITAG